jgi:hypothetical protein
MSLVDDAKKVKARKPNIKDVFDYSELYKLTKAWMNDEIRYSQASVVLTGTTSGNVRYVFATVLKDAYKRGDLTLK